MNAPHTSWRHLQQCSDQGWSQCDRIAVRECAVCGAPLCGKCGPRVLTSWGWIERCRSPLCRFAVVMREAYSRGIRA